MLKFIKNKFQKIRKLPKKYFIGGIVVLVIGFFLFGGNRKATQPQFVEVQKQDLRQEVSASGILTGKDNATLKFKTSGRLAYVNVSPGDEVVRGQVVAGLDTQDLTIALRQAENTLRDKRAIVDKIHDDLKDVSAESYSQRQTRTTAEVAQDNAYDSLLAAQRAFQDAVITSPVNGTIVKSDFRPGQIVSASDVIAQVVDFSQIVFETDVDEADIAKVQLGQTAHVTLNAYGEKIFEGKVIEITPQTKTTSNGATVVTIKISLDDPTIQKISGLNGQVNIVQSEKKNALSIPIDALLPSNSVYVQRGSEVTKQNVKVGFTTESEVEIIEGLEEGDKVVINPNEVTPKENPQIRFRIPGSR